MRHLHQWFWTHFRPWPPQIIIFELGTTPNVFDSVPQINTVKIPDLQISQCLPCSLAVMASLFQGLNKCLNYHFSHLVASPKMCRTPGGPEPQVDNYWSRSAGVAFVWLFKTNHDQTTSPPRLGKKREQVWARSMVTHRCLGNHQAPQCFPYLQRQRPSTGITIMITCGGHFLKIRFLSRTSKVRAGWSNLNRNQIFYKCKNI